MATGRLRATLTDGSVKQEAPPIGRGSSHNSIAGNNVANNGKGITIDRSSNNIIIINKIAETSTLASCFGSLQITT